MSIVIRLKRTCMKSVSEVKFRGNLNCIFEIKNQDQDLSGEFILLITTLKKGEFQQYSSYSTISSSFSIPYLQNISIPCIVFLQRRDENSYLIIKKPLFLSSEFFVKTLSTEDEALQVFKQSSYSHQQSIF